MVSHFMTQNVNNSDHASLTILVYVISPSEIQLLPRRLAMTSEKIPKPTNNKETNFWVKKMPSSLPIYNTVYTNIQQHNA